MELQVNKSIGKPTSSYLYNGASKCSSVCRSEIKFKFSRVKKTDSREQDLPKQFIQNLMQPAHFPHQQIKTNSVKIPTRSYHASLIYKDNLYVYGGYQNQRGILDDFVKYQFKYVNQMCGDWEVQTNKEMNEYPGPRHSHTMVGYKDNIIIFGGKIDMMATTNLINIYSITDKQWKVIQPINPQKGPAPIDSHQAVIYGDCMIVFGGFQKNKYSNTVYSLNIKTLQWQILAQDNKQEQYPTARGDFSMQIRQNRLYIYAGHCSTRVLNDLWEFDLITKKFKKLKDGDSRSGHSAIIHQNKMIIFGGIQGITHERDDLVIYNINEDQWITVWKNTQLDHIKKDQNDQQNPDNTKGKKTIIDHRNKISDQYTEQNNKIESKQMKKYRRPIRQQKQQKAIYQRQASMKRQGENYQRRNLIFSEFNTPKKYSFNKSFEEANHSPLVQSLNNSIILTSNFCNNNSSTKNQKLSVKCNSNKKQSYGKNSILYSRRAQVLQNQSKRLQNQNNFDYINTYTCNLISARDGHSGHLLSLEGTPQMMVIFGGNRHMISYNQIFVLNLSQISPNQSKSQTHLN